MLTIAMPKGRLSDAVYKLLARAGYGCQTPDKDDRRLVLRDEVNEIAYLQVKPSDVAVYVAHGAADIGVIGKDVLDEGGEDVYELLDLRLGKCTMSVAAPNGYRDDRQRTLRVATKYPSTARRYYATRNRDIEIIKLNGSIELAPLLGLSDVIVDIVETGTTLKQNNLSVIETVAPVSARLIANKASQKFKGEAIDRLVAALSKEVSK